MRDGLFTVCDDCKMIGNDDGIAQRHVDTLCPVRCHGMCRITNDDAVQRREKNWWTGDTLSLIGGCPPSDARCLYGQRREGLFDNGWTEERRESVVMRPAKGGN